jgi:Uncharacterized protein conserved in bacteria
MRVLSKRTLVQFWTKHAAARRPLVFWYELVSQSTCKA